jgi:hypothetical protein
VGFIESWQDLKKKGSTMSKNKNLIHDMNSSLAALEQALILLEENQGINSDLVEKILPLSREKMSEILAIWSLVKEEMKKR